MLRKEPMVLSSKNDQITLNHHCGHSQTTTGPITVVGSFNGKADHYNFVDANGRPFSHHCGDDADLDTLKMELEKRIEFWNA